MTSLAYTRKPSPDPHGLRCPVCAANPLALVSARRAEHMQAVYVVRSCGHEKLTRFPADLMLCNSHNVPGCVVLATRYAPVLGTCPRLSLVPCGGLHQTGPPTHHPASLCEAHSKGRKNGQGDRLQVSLPPPTHPLKTPRSLDRD